MSATNRNASDVTFSIITVTRNAERDIAACIRSVVSQTHPHVEHVIIDGQSTDRTVAIARELLRPNDQLFSEADDGIYDAMNRGIRRSKGEYILFVGADDYLVDRGVIADAAAFIAREGSPDAFYGDIEVRTDDRPPSVYSPPETGEALDLMICGCLPHQATFARRSVFESSVGLFDTRYKVQSDYDWFLRLLTAPGITLGRFHRVVTSFAMGGTSSRRLQRGQEETYAIQNGFAPYRTPEWIERRLHAFQRELLATRLELQRTRASASQQPQSSSNPIRRLYYRLRSSLARLTA
jgi:glycosyltransferase involved in cell wall biosynthesis